MESLTGYFQALFLQKKINGMLERAKIDRLRNRAKKRLASKLRERRDACQTNHAKHDFRERGRRNKNWSYLRDDGNCNDCDRPCYHDARSAYEERLECKDRGNCNNQQKRGERGPTGKRRTRHESNERHAKIPKKAWTRNDNNRCNKKEHPNERRKKYEAHHLNNCYTSSDDESPDKGNGTVASDGESHDDKVDNAMITNAREDPFAEEGHNKPLATNGNWAACVVQGNKRHATSAKKPVKNLWALCINKRSDTKDRSCARHGHNAHRGDSVRKDERVNSNVKTMANKQSNGRSIDDGREVPQKPKKARRVIESNNCNESDRSHH